MGVWVARAAGNLFEKDGRASPPLIFLKGFTEEPGEPTRNTNSAGPSPPEGNIFFPASKFPVSKTRGSSGGSYRALSVHRHHGTSNPEDVRVLHVPLFRHLNTCWTSGGVGRSLAVYGEPQAAEGCKSVRLQGCELVARLHAAAGCKAATLGLSGCNPGTVKLVRTFEPCPWVRRGL